MRRYHIGRLRHSLILFGAVAYILSVHVPLAYAAVSITQYSIPTSFTIPVDIIVGPDGNLWATEGSGSGILKITTAGTITEYDISTLQSVGIAAGADGNLWVTEQSNSRIARVTTSGVVTNFSTPFGSNPAFIVAGTDGNLWFTDPGTHSIGKITTSGVVTEYPVVSGSSNPRDVIFGPDGNIWFLEAQSDEICNMSTSGIVGTCYTLPHSSTGLNRITVGPDNNLWFTENFGNRVGKITVSGDITEYSFPGGTQPYDVEAGPDGHLWVTELISHKIAEMNTDGNILNEYDLPNSFPKTIVTGPDNNLWFTESNNIGEVTGLDVPLPPVDNSGGSASVSATTVGAPNTGFGAPTNTGFINTTLIFGSIITASTGLFLRHRQKQRHKLNSP